MKWRTKSLIIVLSDDYYLVAHNIIVTTPMKFVLKESLPIKIRQLQKANE